jgi:hypothetical protein
MSEPGMPFPQRFICPCSKADRLIDRQLQDVEAVDTVRHSRQYSPVFITDLQKFMLDVDATASLPELPKAHYVGL